MADANEALQWGLVNHVTTAENLLPKAMEILQLIHSKAPIAISNIIGCVNAAMQQQENSSGYQKEVEAFGACFATADMKEGTIAFLEKRKPLFSGK
jgi:enoyl-CoA hydratase